MSDPRGFLPAIRAAALLAAAAGIVLTIASAHNAPARVRQTRRKLDELRDLRRIEAELATLLAARHAWEGTSGRRLASLEDIFRQLALDLAAPEIVEHEPDPLADGWRRRRVEILFHEAPLEWIGRFAAAAAEARPPWRLAEIRVAASETARGYGRATLVMEGLEHPTPETGP